MAKITPLIYQLKVALKYSKPPIWRRLLVRSDIKLHQFHDVLQASFGWLDMHMHEFICSEKSYGVIDEDFPMEHMLDEKKVKLDQILTNENKKMQYIYDFGDFWEHNITLEKVLPSETVLLKAQCIDGKRSGPVEDCGGIYGYQHMLKVLANPSDPEFEDMEEWCPKDFDAEEFSIDKINVWLARGC